MEVFIYLIPFTLLISVVGLIALLWSIKSKQYDDLEGSKGRILIDDEDEKL